MRGRRVGRFGIPEEDHELTNQSVGGLRESLFFRVFPHMMGGPTLLDAVAPFFPIRTLF